MFGRSPFGGFPTFEVPQNVRDQLADKARMWVRRQLIGAPIYMPRTLTVPAREHDDQATATYEKLGLKVYEPHPKNDRLFIVDAPSGWRVEPLSEDSDQLVLRDEQKRNRVGIYFNGRGEQWTLQGIFMPLVMVSNRVENGQQLQSITANGRRYQVYAIDAADDQLCQRAKVAFDDALTQVLPQYTDVEAYWDMPVNEIEDKLLVVANAMQAALQQS